MIEECRFPALDEPYDCALREAVAWVLERYQPLGIVATGSIIRGNPGPTSDHDLYVLVEGKTKQRFQRVFNGVPAEIFVNPPAAVDGYLDREAREHRRVTAHMLATGFVVLDRDPAVARLRGRAIALNDAAPDLSEAQVTWLRYAAALVLEDAEDVRESDPDSASLLLANAVIEMLRYVFFARENRLIPRWKELIGEIDALDPETGTLAREFLRAPSLDERFELARALADRVVGARGFFEWESDPEEV